MELIEIRPHHLLCAQGFQGYGYDGEFTVNLARLVTMFNENPATEVILVSGCDSICGYCPKKKGSICENEDRIAMMDKEVLRATGIEAGLTAEISQLFKKVNECITTKAAAESVCGGCEWTDICLWHGRLA